MNAYVSYPFDIDDQLLKDLQSWTAEKVPLKEAQNMGGFDGNTLLPVIEFVVLSALSGATYDIAKHIFLKLKARWQSGKSQPAFNIKLPLSNEAFLFMDGTYFHLTSEGKREISEAEWLEGVTKNIE
ncbi:MAG: hypothetical protein AAGF87_16270 [Bacteroidota bacterium]